MQKKHECNDGKKKMFWEMTMPAAVYQMQTKLLDILNVFIRSPFYCFKFIIANLTHAKIPHGEGGIYFVMHFN